MKPSYFLVSLSNRGNLELCITHALAGFTNSISGLWTFLDIQEGDFLSFLYAARAFNLYRVVRKEAMKDADKAPPWPAVTFRSGYTYNFPFRLHLEPIRAFNEPLVRAEFAYVAENLLLRGGYRRTHFQADQTTLQAVSQMGSLYSQPVEPLDHSDFHTFVPKLTLDRGKTSPPEVFLFSEIILQAAIRAYLSSSANLGKFLSAAGIDALDAASLEVLGEKALPEGHIDLLIKESVPLGLARKVVVEVKLGQATNKDMDQVVGYLDEMGEECIAGAIIARGFPKRVLDNARHKGIKAFVYSFGAQTRDVTSYGFHEIMDTLHLTIV